MSDAGVHVKGRGGFRLESELEAGGMGPAVWYRGTMVVVRGGGVKRFLYAIGEGGGVEWVKPMEDRSGHKAYPLFVGRPGRGEKEEMVTLRGEKPKTKGEGDGVKVLVAVGKAAYILSPLTGSVLSETTLDFWPIGAPTVGVDESAAAVGER